MRHAAGEVSTTMADLSSLSMDDLRTSDDPVLLRSIRLVAGRAECSRMGVLQNEAPEER